MNFTRITEFEGPLMIAAGSLFTSCVTNTEPQGVKDLREAKADYLASLARLRDADAALVKANAAYRDAETAWQETQNELAKLKVAWEQAWTDAEVAKMKADLEKDLVVKAKALAEAEYNLQQYLNQIAVSSKFLTETEQWAIYEYTDAYDKYIAALKKVREEEGKVYDSTLSFEAYLLKTKEDSANAVATIALYEELINNLPDSGQSDADTAAFRKKYDQQTLEIAYAKANIEKDWNLYQSTEVNPAIKSFASELVDWTAQNVALPAPFQMHYKAQLPDNDQIFKTLAYYINGDKFPVGSVNNGEASFSVGHKPGVAGMEVVRDVDGKYWLLANYYSAPQARYSIWGNNVFGIDETDTRSLAAVVEALRRELVVDSTKYGIDTTGMAAAVKAAEEDYAKTEAALIAGIKADTAVNKAKDDYNAAVEALGLAKGEYALAKADFEADTDALFAAVDSFVGTWNRVANTTRFIPFAAPVTGQLNSQDSVDIFNALVNVIAARKAVFPEEKQYYYYYRQEGFFPVKAVKDSVEISPDSLKFSGIQRNLVNYFGVFKSQSLYGGQLVENPSWGQQPVTWENANELGWLLAAAFESFETLDKEGFSEKFFGKEAVLDTINTPSQFGPDGPVFYIHTVKIKPIEKDDFVAALSKDEAGKNYRYLFFDKYAYKPVKQAIVEANTQDLYLRLDVETAIVDYNDAVDDADDANTDLCDAVEKYYYNVYGKYWGLTAEDLNEYLFDNSAIAIGLGIERHIAPAEPSFDIDDLLKEHNYVNYTKFKEPTQDSLEIIFKPETYTKFRNIVNFSKNDFGYDKATKKFSYGTERDVDLIGAKISPDHNEELTIVLKELAGNQGSKFEAQGAYFGQHLFTKVLFKKYVLANVSTGTQGTQESLAALKTVCDDIVKAYEKAIEKQSADSQDFYKFVEGLVGKETLAYIFDGLDNALTKAVEFIPAYAQVTRSEDDIILGMCYDVINKIAAKEITSKDALIAIFEDFMSGEFGINTSENKWQIELLKPFIGRGSAKYLADAIGIESYSSDANKKDEDFIAVDGGYRKAYEALQLADAFSGEQFRTLLADVINNYLNALGIDITAQVADIGDDIIEKLIFGTVRAMTTEFGYIDKNEATINDILKKLKVKIEASDLKIILVATTTVLNHIYENCDGIISQLDKKYLTEWRTNWAEYDVNMSAIEAQEKALKVAKNTFDKYVQGISSLLDLYNSYTENIEAAKKDYKDACAKLEKLYAGVDWKTQAYEESQDKLAQAKLALEIAEQRLAQAKKAYDQVLANHKND